MDDQGAVGRRPVGACEFQPQRLGNARARRIDVDRVQRRLMDPANEAVRNSLREVGIDSAVDLFANYAGQVSDMGPWLKDGQINTDSNLRLQYLAAMGASEYQEAAIYREIVKRRQETKLPFAGSQEALNELKYRWENPTRARGPKKRTGN